MKKVFFSFIGAAIIIGAVVFNISISSHGESMSDLALANIEALAQGEGGGMEEWATAMDPDTGRPKCCAEVASGSCSLSVAC